LDKQRTRQIIDSMKRNVDGSFYLMLTEYLKIRIYEIQELLVKTDASHEIYRLQGRATELTEMLKALSRKPLAEQATGAFN